MLALLGICKPGLGYIIILASGHTLRQEPAFGREQVMQPFAALPKQLDVCRETEITLVAGRIRQAQVLVLKTVFPFGVQYALKAVYVKKRSKTVADGTYYLAVLDRVGWVYQHAAEHLHMDASVKHLYQAVIGQTRIWLEEHKRNFTFRREQWLFPAGTLVASTCELCCQLLDGKLGMDTPKFAFCKAITVVLQKIKFCKGQTGCYIRNFLYLHDVFLTNFPRFCP